MKVWLDDWYPAPAGWVRAKTRDQAIALLTGGQVDEISLDYDINWDPGGNDDDWENTRTGMAVVLWMEANKVWPKDVGIHSRNVEGAMRMRLVLERNGICEKNFK
jgi:hypothetical protein